MRRTVRALSGVLLWAGMGAAFPTMAAAQHCPFDGTAILVVDVRDAETQCRIKSLRLTIVDENGHPVSQKMQEQIGSEFVLTPLIFCENPVRTDPDWKPYQFKKIRYSFAGDNYLLPLSPHQGSKTYIVKVEDIDGEANGAYRVATYTAKAEDYFNLHDNVGWPHIGDNAETLSPREEFHHTILLRLDRKGRQAPGRPALTSIRTPLRLGLNHSCGNFRGRLCYETCPGLSPGRRSLGRTCGFFAGPTATPGPADSRSEGQGES